jgi:aminoglycoside phosphotransferase (APT) family kinase protein
MILYNEIISTRKDVVVSSGEFRGAKVAVKSFSDHRKYGRELGALKISGEAGAPVPDVIWSGLDHGRFVIVQTWVEGKLGADGFKAASEHARTRMAIRAGETLALLGTSTERFVAGDASFIRYIEGARQDGDCDWQRLLGTQLRKWQSKLNAKTVHELGGDAELQKLMRWATAPYSGVSSLVHCDYLLRNIIFGHDGKATIIDFGAAMIGDPQYDLGKIVWRDFAGVGTEASSAFTFAWSQATGISVSSERLAIYVACHCLAALAWVDKQAALSNSDVEFRRLALSGFAQARAMWR